MAQKIGKLTLKVILNINESKFSESFWQIANKMNDEKLLNFLTTLKPVVNEGLSFTNSNGQNSTAGKISSVSFGEKSYFAQDFGVAVDEVSIYYPYSELYIDPITNVGNYSPQTSIIGATADADEGLGWYPVQDGIDGVAYDEVIVNDEYSEAHPTHIIGINGVHVINSELTNNFATFPPGAPIVVPNLPRTVKQVYVGDVRCKKQYDALISFTGNGGGSEIRFTRSDGFLKVSDGQVQADHFITQGPDNISRYNIRKANWVDWTVQWDADWESDNLEQNLAVYEEDNRNTITFNTTLSTKLKILGLETTGTIGVAFNFKSDDAIIRQQNHKYATFFALNRGYAGEPTRSGWLIYDNNSQVSFTLPDRTLIQ